MWIIFIFTDNHFLLSVNEQFTQSRQVNGFTTGLVNYRPTLGVPPSRCHAPACNSNKILNCLGPQCLQSKYFQIQKSDCPLDYFWWPILMTYSHHPAPVNLQSFALVLLLHMFGMKYDNNTVDLSKLECRFFKRRNLTTH